MSHERFDPIDHVMTYFFTDSKGLEEFTELATALWGAGRKLPLLPPVERGAYEVRSKAAAPRVKIGADVLPWWPVRGVFLLVEQGPETGTVSPSVLDVDGVAGVWSASALHVDARLASAQPSQSVTYCFLDDDPVETAARLKPVLTKRWRELRVEPLLAAPFFAVVPHEWDRYVP